MNENDKYRRSHKSAKGGTLNYIYAYWINTKLKPLANAARERTCMQTIDNVLTARNLTEACREVVKNKGSAGIDCMGVKQLKAYLETDRGALIVTIHKGEYIP
jgi:hypothetical protein